MSRNLLRLLSWTALLVVVGGLAFAGKMSVFGTGLSDRDSSPNQLSLPRSVKVKKGKVKLPGRGRSAVFPKHLRSVDGSSNNKANPTWGSVGVEFLRLVPSAYADGVGEPSGADRPGAREISNLCVDQAEEMLHPDGVSDMFWQWGQFLDHDLTLTPEIAPREAFPIPIPMGDPHFDPLAEGDHAMGFGRSFYVMVDGVREQINQITAFVDGSNVYGSDLARRAALRTHDGTGRLLTSEGDLLPFNTQGLPNAPSSSPEFYLGGDFRANEQVGLTAMHTVFVREHNFWADRVSSIYPELDDDGIFRWAQAIVIGEIQAITYREFLPLLLGPGALGRYEGYDPNVDPTIDNAFAAAAFRFGHSMLSDRLFRFDAQGNEVPAGHLPLREAFFNPTHVAEEGIDSVLRGLAFHPAQRLDPRVVDDVRNFLFGPPGSGGFDLASLNIQRGRDHGLAPYNDFREAYGLGRIADFGEVSENPEVGLALAEAYDSVDDIDLWVGGLAEDPVPGAMVGETLVAILAEQFGRLRAGDRFWYESYLPLSWVKMVTGQTLAVVIRRNTGIGRELGSDPFHVPKLGLELGLPNAPEPVLDGLGHQPMKLKKARKANRVNQ